MRINQTEFAVIVLPREATARERFAAEELQSYIQKIVGILLPIVEDSDADVQRFIIGGPARNMAARSVMTEAEFGAAVTGDEGFLIRSFGTDTILLAGREGSAERGTIYAVYEFLERYLDCSLSAFSHPELDAGEYVPTRQEICLDAVDYVKAKADCALRGAVVQFSDAAGNVERGLNSH